MTIIFTCPQRRARTFFMCDCPDKVTILQCPACNQRHEYDHETEEIISHARVGKMLPWFGILLVLCLAILGIVVRLATPVVASN